jgi:hypothetical protein
VLQYSVIVKNNTTRAIRGTGVLYTSDFGLGRAYDDLNATVNLPPMPILLQPGAIRFDCILPGVGDAVQSGRLAEYSQRRSFQERMQFHISRDLLMKGIKVSLDFVLFDDGSFIGPDKLRRFQWMMRGTSAEQEFVKSLGAMRGQSDASVGAFLQNEANAAEPEHRAPVVDIDPTVHRQKQLAKQFLIAFRSAGSNAVFTALDSYIAQHPQFNIHRGNDQ